MTSTPLINISKLFSSMAKSKVYVGTVKNVKLPKSTQRILEQIERLIRDAIPKVSQNLGVSVPTKRKEGRV